MGAGLVRTDRVILSHSFQVGATVKSAQGGGRLIVAPGTLVLEPGPVTRRLTDVERVLHSSNCVTMFKGRLLPPYMNTHIVIEGGEVVALATLPGWSRRRVRVALREAGFQLEERSGWIYMGRDLIRPLS